MPKRIQRRREKGWRKSKNTVYVGRGSKWGNIFKVGSYLSLWRKAFVAVHLAKENNKKVTDIYDSGILNKKINLDDSIKWYKYWIKFRIKNNQLDINELKGKNLMCWCPLNQICHADYLLEIANDNIATDNQLSVAFRDLMIKEITNKKI